MMHCKLQVHEKAETAPHYKPEEVMPAKLEEMVVVKKGTEEGNATIDLLFTDSDGKKHVALITANILKMALVAAGTIAPQ